jgi:predicted transposase/invertase (TIGR01784 family)
MENTNSLLPVKSDFVFKLIFGDQRNVDILGDFLRSVLDISEDEYDRLTIIDPHVKKESENDKYGILDVKVHTKNGTVLHVEIQVKPVPDMKPRIVYSQAKMITEQISAGANWSVINRTISIIITDYTLVEENSKYHNQFRYRSQDGTELTRLSEINTLELNKLPQNADNSELWYWMKFIKSDDKEVLDMIAERNPRMKKAVGVLMELSADERTRMLYEEREIARRDIASMMEGAKREGHAEGHAKGHAEGRAKGHAEGHAKGRAEGHAKALESLALALKLLKRNRPIEEIVEDTGLSRGEIEMLMGR